MLNGKQLAVLRVALTPTGPQDGAGRFCGNTYKEIATLLSKEFELTLSARSVRAYVGQLKKDARYQGLCTPPRGRPVRKDTEAILASAVNNELLRLTGLSASKLYQQIKLAAAAQTEIMSKATFQRQLKRQPGVRAPLGQRKKDNLMQRCRLRLHQVVFEIEAAVCYWVILAGYEETTRFVNVALYEVHRPTQRNKRGRPKSISRDLPDALISGSGDAATLQLPAQVILNFYAETRDRLGFPLNRVFLCQSVLPNPCILGELQKAEPGLSYDVESMLNQRHLLPTCDVSLPLQTLADLLSTRATEHNSRVTEAGIASLIDEINTAPDRIPKFSLFSSRRKNTKAGKIVEQLEKYYLQPDHTFPKREPSPIHCHPIQLSASLSRLNNMAKKTE